MGSDAAGQAPGRVGTAGVNGRILVGFVDLPPTLAGCPQATSVDNGVGLAGQEQGAPVTVCSGMSEPWSVAWPAFRHLD